MDYQWFVDNFNKERQYYGSAEKSGKKGFEESIQVPHYEVESSDEDDLNAFLDKFSAIPHSDENEDVIEFDELPDEEEDVVEFLDPSEEEEGDIIDVIEPPEEEEYEIIGNNESPMEGSAEEEKEKEKKTAFDKYGDEIDQLIDKYREVIE